MGLMLYPGDGDVTSPDVEWSYRGFAEFRRWLAQSEGFDLDEMYGFGGVRPWSGVSTPLEPLLDQRDVDCAEFTSAQCAAMLPRLEAIVDRRRHDGGDPDLRRHLADARQLVVVMRLCLDKDVELYFG